MKKTNVSIPLQDVELEGELCIPESPKGLIIFSHGSGSSRNSPRNKMVADVLNENNFATLLFDLLTTEEDQNYDNRFNIPVLSRRLTEVAVWAMQYDETKKLNIGLFGASTGAASALYTSAALGIRVRAVVSRGGRPDMALEALPLVKSPVLLIVGEYDEDVIEMNKTAYNSLCCKKDMQIVPGATHLFEEPGTMQIVADLASKWFKQCFTSSK